MSSLVTRFSEGMYYLQNSRYQLLSADLQLLELGGSTQKTLRQLSQLVVVEESGEWRDQTGVWGCASHNHVHKDQTGKWREISIITYKT